MNRVLSWKIASGVYAYIFKPDGKSYISNRISEDSPIWKDTINTISEWDETVYKTNFDLMKKEVSEKYGISLTYKPEYWEYNSGNENLSTNIVILAGKDGVGGGYGSGSGGNGDIGDGLDYEELADYINGKIDAAKKDIEEQNEKVKDFIHDEVVNTIGDAKADIEQTKKDLDEIRTEFTEDLKGAKEALDKAAELFGDGNINSEQIQNVFSTVDEHKEWFDEYSGNVASLVYDYNEVLQEMGGIGVASAASKGLFSMFAESLNAISGTVGDVERTMNASLGEIKDIATWYDTSAATVTEASRLILASAAVISDTVKYMQESGITAEVQRQIDGAKASIIDTVKSETTSGITYIEQTLNGLSGIVATELINLEATTSAITSIGNRFNATDATINQWMTKTDSAMSITNDLREHWSIESGKLSTVANLTAETDANGNIIYYVSGTTGDETVVYKTDDGKWTDGTNIYNDSQVYVHFSKTIASYIQQQTSSVTISVMNDNITAAIKVAIKEDAEGEKAIINMVADEVVITGEMIADAIKANQANIGGIWMGRGIIESQAQSANGNPMFRLDGNNGTLYAQNADIKGVITATELRLGSSYGNKDISEYISGYVRDNINFPVTDLGDYVKFDVKNGDDTKSFTFSKDGLLTANNAVIQGTIVAKDGYIGDIEIKDGGLSGPNFSMTKTGLTMTSSLIQPYTEIDTNDSSYFSSDSGRQGGNFFFTGNKIINGKNESNVLPPLECNTDQIGRRISITNNISGIITNDFAVATMTLPEGFYFFEDGRRNEMLRLCNEVIDLIGYGSTDNSAFYGWTVLTRKSFLTNKSYGHTLEALCTGVIDLDSGIIEKLNAFDNTYFISSACTYTSWDKSNPYSRYWNGVGFEYLSTTNSGSNAKYLRMPDTWFDRTASQNNNTRTGDNADVFVQLTPIDTLANVCYKDISASGFTIQASTKCKVGFTIYNRGSWRCLPNKNLFDIFCMNDEGKNINYIDLTAINSPYKFNIFSTPSEYDIDFTWSDAIYTADGTSAGSADEYIELETYFGWDYNEMKYVKTAQLSALSEDSDKTVTSTLTLTLLKNGSPITINNGGNPITVKWEIEVARIKYEG